MENLLQMAWPFILMGVILLPDDLPSPETGPEETY